MAIGNIRLASEVARPGGRTGADGAMSALAHRIAGSLPRFGGGDIPVDNTGSKMAKALEDAQNRRLKEADDRAAEIAQNLQTELSDTSINLYQRQGSAADGIVGEWEKAANDKIKEIGAELDGLTRERLKLRMAPWLASRRENLYGHQTREVRKGKIANLESALDQAVSIESADIVMQARDSQPSDGEDFQIVSGLYLDQLAAAAAAKKENLDKAVEEGLISKEQAAATAKGFRGKMLKDTISAMIKDGSDRPAEAMLRKIEEDKGKFAEICGVDGKDIVAWRDGIEGVRMRRDAEAKRLRAEELKAARDAAYGKIIKMHQDAGIPTTDEERQSYFAEMAAGYKDLANDDTLDESTRLSFAQAAESLGFKSESARQAGIAHKKAEQAEKERKSAADARESAMKEEARIKGNEKSLARALMLYNLAKLDGGARQEELNELQAKLWTRFSEQAYKGDVGTSFSTGFMNSMRAVLSAQESDAMRKFLFALGYKGAVDSSGLVPRGDRQTVSEAQYAPVSSGDALPNISGEMLLELQDGFLRDLRTLGPDVNREGMVDSLVSKMQKKALFADWSASLENILANPLQQAFWKSVLEVRSQVAAGRTAGAAAGNESKKEEKTEEKKESNKEEKEGGGNE